LLICTLSLLFGINLLHLGLDSTAVLLLKY